MGFGDFHPFQLPHPVRTQLEFPHDMVTHAPLTLEGQAVRVLPEPP